MSKIGEKRKRTKTVKDASIWETMAGDTSLEKMLNAYLTCHFIMQYDVPVDECLSEAQKIIGVVYAYGGTGDTGAAFTALGKGFKCL